MRKDEQATKYSYKYPGLIVNALTTLGDGFSIGLHVTLSKMLVKDHTNQIEIYLPAGNSRQTCVDTGHMEVRRGFGNLLHAKSIQVTK